MSEDARPAEARVLVIAAPSGTGKTTVARRLVGSSPARFRFSVSATTRAPRGGEKDGVDYHFVERDRFEEMVESGEFMEHANVHGRLYGTPWSEVLGHAASDTEHRITVLDIDVQGALQVRERLNSAILVFLLPPSGAVLVERLRGRGTDEGDEIDRRMAGALAELDHAEEFDYVVVNDQLDETVATVSSIARAHAVAVREQEWVRQRTDALKSEIEEAARAAREPARIDTRD